MRTREEYNKILDTTFVQSGTEGLERVRLDILLDIRELLLWLKEDIMLKQVIEERNRVTSFREANFVEPVFSIDITGK